MLTDDEIRERCDWLVSDRQFLEWLCAYWLKNGETAKRRQANGALVQVLKDMGLSQQDAHIFQRGFIAGVDFTAAIFRPRADA